jgi:hypothetical protein
MIEVTYNTSEKTTCRCCGKVKPDWGINFLTDGQTTGGTKVFLCTKCALDLMTDLEENLIDDDDWDEW